MWIAADEPIVSPLYMTRITLCAPFCCIAQRRRWMASLHGVGISVFVLCIHHQSFILRYVVDTSLQFRSQSSRMLNPTSRVLDPLDNVAKRTKSRDHSPNTDFTVSGSHSILVPFAVKPQQILIQLELLIGFPFQTSSRDFDINSDVHNQTLLTHIVIFGSYEAQYE